MSDVNPVLLIEDDPDIRILAEMILRMNGIDVVACADGHSGLQALEGSAFSLVILDVMMPDMSGYEVLNRMNERMGEQSPPVAIFSSRPQDATAKDMAGRSNVYVLSKPFEPAQLAETVQNLIRK